MSAFTDGTAPPMHRARATLPARLAALLVAEPQLVAPAVDAFYNRDVAAMKVRVSETESHDYKPRVSLLD